MRTIQFVTVPKLRVTRPSLSATRTLHTLRRLRNCLALHTLRLVMLCVQWTGAKKL